MSIWFEAFSEGFQRLVRRAIIEPPLTLFEEEIEVSFGDSVVFSQVLLGLVPEILDAIDVVMLVGKQLRMIEPEMVEVGDVEYIIAAVAISIDNAVRLDFARNYGGQRVGYGILDRHCEHFASPASATQTPASC